MTCRPLLILLVALTTWVGSLPRLLPEDRASLRHAAPGELAPRERTAVPAPDCGCDGQCGMPACGCGVRESDPAPIDREHSAPASRDSKPIVLGLPRQPAPGWEHAAHAPRAGPVRAARAPHWSYDSPQAFFCVWRS